MKGLISAELTKLRSRATLVGVITVVILFGLFMAAAASWADTTTTSVEATHKQIELYAACSVQDCPNRERALRQLETTLQHLGRADREAQAAASATAVPSLIFGSMGSGLGMLVAFLAGAGMIALEFRNGTMPFLLLRRPRRLQVLLSKVTVAIGLTWVTVGAACVVLIPTVGLLRGARDTSILGLPSIAQQLVAPVSVSVLFGVAGVVLSLWLHSSVAAVASITGMLAVDFLGGLTLGSRFSFNRLLWSLGEGFHSNGSPSSTTFWIGPRFLGNPDDPLLAGALVILLTCVLLLLGALRFRSDRELAFR